MCGNNPLGPKKGDFLFLIPMYFKVFKSVTMLMMVIIDEPFFLKQVKKKEVKQVVITLKDHFAS